MDFSGNKSFLINCIEKCAAIVFDFIVGACHFIYDKIIVSKVSKGDNVVVRSADFYFSIVINFFSTLLLYLYSNGKKGK